jgi:hypothetical protein
MDTTGTDITPVYVRFGPRPTQIMPLDWAEHILTEWAKSHPPQFGKALSEAALGAR